MRFTEETLEQAVIELFEEEDIQHVNGKHIHKELNEVLLREDLKQYLLNKCSDDDITLNEIAGIIRQLEVFSSSALYESNKSILKLIADGFVLKREDRSKKDLFIHLIDYDTLSTDKKKFKKIQTEFLVSVVFFTLQDEKPM
jgi:type I restriction enzyme R subunit